MTGVAQKGFKWCPGTYARTALKTGGRGDKALGITEGLLHSGNDGSVEWWG